jgi:Tol biopolymer transport system component/tRNA A-37 threonylcarbamoyl transferase component Bud32
VDAPATNTGRLNAALAGRYRIEKQLGAGGMATVYLAYDEKHDRKVAIKVLKPELAAVLGAERFVVEIKTTASLSHPHILPLFDSGTADGFLFYVMPYIQGETIREKLNRETQFGVDEAIRITREVADALDYAHRHGVIHRDIKPENLLLHDGRAMVMDFGIAIAVSAAAGGRMTETGLSLGTPHYMSPEQATAEKEITGRSDVYSLGSVLYEMLTGNPPHIGATAQQVIMKIISESAEPVTKYRKSVPPNVAAAVAQAVEKLPADRFESAKAFADALADPLFGAAAHERARVAASLHTRSRRVVPLVAASAVGILALIAGVWIGRSNAPRTTQQPVRFDILPPDSTGDISRCCGRAMAMSPDGSEVVFVVVSGGRGALYRRRLDALESVRIPGTEEGAIPFYSPDGTSLAFASPTELKRMPVTGGPVATIVAGANISGASWAETGDIFYAFQDRIWTVPAAGGTPRALSEPPPDARHLYPFALPGGRKVLFTLRNRGGSLEASRVGVLDVASGRIDTVVAGVRAEFIDGQLVFVTPDLNLMSVAFNPVSGKVSGAPRLVVENVMLHGISNPEFAVSAPGWLLYQPGGAGGDRELRIVNGASGASRQVTLAGHDGAFITYPSVSPSGRYVALTLVTSPTEADTWILDLVSGNLNRFTSDGSVNAVWSPDGKQLAYLRRRGSANEVGIYVAPVDLSTAPRLVLTGPAYFPSAWTPDQKSIVFTAAQRPRSRYDIGMITIGDTIPRWLREKPENEMHGQVSPDGRWLAFRASAGGPEELYVQPMPPREAPAVQISLSGGGSPRWSADSKTLYYVSGSSIVAASLATGNGVTVTSRAKFADVPRAETRNEGLGWALMPSGKDAMVVDVARTGSDLRIILVQDWMRLIAGAR